MATKTFNYTQVKPHHYSTAQLGNMHTHRIQLNSVPFAKKQW